ncbi:MAG: sporulation protein YtfJ [Firmicutes bacterium]|nr:sporulation protein YtfJ [Bacillota bacterium]
MTEHPIQGLMTTAMENLKEMIDVTKVVGDPVETPDGHVIIPVSKVAFGFVTGGSEFESEDEEISDATASNQQLSLPFGGGSGGGVSIHPMAFLVVAHGEVKLLPVDRSAILDRLVDLAPQVIHYLQDLTTPEESEDIDFKF